MSAETTMGYNAFGSGKPFTVGVEEQSFLVDPVTGRQANASMAVQARLGPVEGTVERELHACPIELITEVCNSAGLIALPRSAQGRGEAFTRPADRGARGGHFPGGPLWRSSSE